jgi:hypothetical protein
MKSFRWTLIAVALVAALFVFTIYDFKRSESTQEQSEKEKSIIKLNLSDIIRVEVLNRMGSIVVEKQDGEWHLTSPVKDKADTQAIESLLSQIEGEKTISTVVEGDNIQFETFGLKQPVTRLKLQVQDGKSEEIKIGAIKAFDGNLYAQIDDEKRVSLVSQSWDSLLAKSPNDLRDKHLLRTDFNAEDLMKIEFKSPDFTLVKVGPHWKMAKGAIDFPLVDDFIKQFIDKLKGTRALNLHKHEPIKAAYEISLFNKVKPFFHASLGEEKKADRGAATVEAQSSDYQDGLTLTAAVVETLRRTPQDFYDKKFAFQFSASDVARIEIESNDLKAKFNGKFIKKGDNWESVEPALQNRVDSSKLNALVTKLSGLQAVRVLDSIEKTKKLKNQSRIILMKAQGEPVFEFAWGDVAIEKATASRPEARYYLAHTNKADVILGVSEGEVKGLGLDNLLKEAPKATTLPGASPSSSPSPAPSGTTR